MPVFAKKILIPLHVLGVAGLFLLNWDLYELLIILFSWFVIGCIGIEIGYHRLLSHKAFHVSKFMQNIISLIGCYGAQWSPIWWVALHQGYHHPGADTDRDLHSPIHGKWHAFIGWYFSIKPDSVNLKAAKRLITDKFQLFLHKNYLKIFWIPIILLGLIDIQLALCIFVFPALLSLHQENIINIVCHTKSLSYRNFNIKDNSGNNLLLGWIFWGAGFHNNHHAKPNTYHFGVKWYEFDICKYVVYLIMLIDKPFYKIKTS